MASVRRFTLNTGKLPEGFGAKGQAKVIVDHMRDNPGQTVGEMTKAIGKFEGSRQDPERVIAFYMGTWKKKGYVAVAEEEVAKEDTKGESDEADSGDDEDEAEEDAEEGERLPMEERVEFHEELSAAEPSPGGKYDGLKMTEAVKKVLQRGGVNSAENIAAYLTDQGYTASKNQVSGALINLVKQGVAKKSDLNTYSIK